MKPPCGAVFTGTSAFRRDQPSEPIESRNDAEAMTRQALLSLIPRADSLGSARLTKKGRGASSDASGVSTGNSAGGSQRGRSARLTGSR